MASVCLYFQIHQPDRLRRYGVFDSDHDYFDHPRNAQILTRVAERCYTARPQELTEEVRG
jgi:alpha-amylase